MPPQGGKHDSDGEFGSLTHYDFSARIFNPAIGRFLSIDPLTDEFPSWTPYHFVHNNPVRLTDPAGMKADSIPNSNEENFVAMGPEVTVTASRSGLHNQTVERYGFNGTLKQWQEKYGCKGCSPENTRNFWSVGDNGAFDNYVAEQDKAEAARVAVEKMSFWMGQVFPTIATVVSPSGGVGNGGVIGSGLKLRNFNFSSPVSSTIKPVHGNSLSSQRPTWFYKLYSNDGTFLKNGITSAIRPELRYTRSFMADKYMSNTRLFPNRRSAYDFEFQQNIILRGTLNKNMH